MIFLNLPPMPPTIKLSADTSSITSLSVFPYTHRFFPGSMSLILSFEWVSNDFVADRVILPMMCRGQCDHFVSAAVFPFLKTYLVW